MDKDVIVLEVSCVKHRMIQRRKGGSMEIEEITVYKKSDDTLITRIFQDEEGIKQITSDDYEVEIKTERSENMEEVREALKQWILNELKNTFSMETGSILPEMLNVYLALFAL